MSLRRRLSPAAAPLLRVWWRSTRGMTLGARVLACDGAGRVGLVRHTYTEGWHLPGGGVERGERAEEAARRELEEELGVTAFGPLRLIGVYANFRWFRGDHVLLYRFDGAEPAPRPPDREIEAVGWFAPDALPEAATPATRRRVAETFFQAPPTLDW